MIALGIIIYLVLGVVMLSADSMATYRAVRCIWNNDIYFTFAVIFWPLVWLWARWKWRTNEG